jgi:hypothetical protein
MTFVLQKEKQEAERKRVEAKVLLITSVLFQQDYQISNCNTSK